jgi:hypothetical protein
MNNKIPMKFSILIKLYLVKIHNYCLKIKKKDKVLSMKKVNKNRIKMKVENPH